MNWFRTGLIRQVLSLALVIIVLNVSIDPPDLLLNLDDDFALEEDISINEMESLSEILLEKVFDFDGVVPEADEDDAENYLKKVEIFQAFYALTHLSSQPIFFMEECCSRLFIFREQTSIGISSPPPRA